MLYEPAPRLLNTLPTCQFKPPLIEYSIEPAPLATIVMLPSDNPQLLGSIGVTLAIVGAIGDVRMTSGSVTAQVPSAFLTRTW